MRYSESELSLQRGKTTVFDRHEIRLRVRVSSLAIRFRSFLRRYRTGSTKYNRLVHKFRHRSTPSFGTSVQDTLP